jgi:hypothetical protein
MNTDSRQQIKPTRDTLSILAVIEVAIGATEDSIEIHELIWVRDMLRVHAMKEAHSTSIQ